jgi:hypothetical protein
MKVKGERRATAPSGAVASHVAQNKATLTPNPGGRAESSVDRSFPPARRIEALACLSLVLAASR